MSPYFIEVEPTIEKIPPAHKLMEDREFQKWLLKSGLMEQSREPIVHPATKLTRTEKYIWDTLVINAGFIVPPLRLLPKRRVQTDDKHTRHTLRVHMNRLNDSFDNGIYTAHGFGYALKVKNLKIHSETGRLIYKFWQNLGTETPRDDLIKTFQKEGEDDDSTGFRIRTHVWRLRNEALPGTKVALFSGDHGYLLKEVK